jgi:hypothetical protein
VELAAPEVAEAAPMATTKNSTPSALNTDNMSLKSGFSTLRFSLEGPGIEG